MTPHEMWASGNQKPTVPTNPTPVAINNSAPVPANVAAMQGKSSVDAGSGKSYDYRLVNTANGWVAAAGPQSDKWVQDYNQYQAQGYSAGIASDLASGKSLQEATNNNTPAHLREGYVKPPASTTGPNGEYRGPGYNALPPGSPWAPGGSGGSTPAAPSAPAAGSSGGTANASGNSQAATGGSVAAGSTGVNNSMNTTSKGSNDVGSRAYLTIGDITGSNNKVTNDSSWNSGNSGSIANSWNFSTGNRGSVNQSATAKAEDDYGFSKGWDRYLPSERARQSITTTPSGQRLAGSALAGLGV